MATAAQCGGSCGRRLPLTEFPVVKNDPLHRAAGICSQCLQEALHFDNVPCRAATAEENAAFLEHQQSLKRKRGDASVDDRGRRLKAPIPAVVTCRVCYEEKNSVTEYPAHFRPGQRGISSIPVKCQKHIGLRAEGGAVCNDCISRALTAAFETSGCTATGCWECRTPWDPKYVALYLSTDMFARYCDDLLAVKVTNRANFVYCPDPHCGSGGLTYKRSRGWPQVQCGDCGARACASCKVAWHEGISCALQQAIVKYGKDNSANLKHLERIGARMCPRCSVVIEKNGGCHNMQCYKCRKAFNWELAEPVVGPTSVAAKHQALEQHGAHQPTAALSDECEADEAGDSEEPMRKKKKVERRAIGVATTRRSDTGLLSLFGARWGTG